MQENNIIQLNPSGEPTGVPQVAPSLDIKIGTVNGNAALQFNIPVMLLQMEPQMAIDFAEAFKAHAQSLLQGTTAPTREMLDAAVQAAQNQLNAASLALTEFIALPQNNVFESLEEAVSAIEGRLENQAHADCEGSHNRGEDVYEQEFIVGDIRYLGKLKCEYNRHDKTYYYVEESEFTYEPIDDDGL